LRAATRRRMIPPVDVEPLKQRGKAVIEALWSVEFSTNVGSFGAGVVVLETGRVLGGDSSFIYIGKFHVDKSIVHLEVESSRYNMVVQLPSIFGNLNKFTLRVSGPVNANEVILVGHVVEHPTLEVKVHAIRRAELP
jgi:hypothetical protein